MGYLHHSRREREWRFGESSLQCPEPESVQYIDQNQDRQEATVQWIDSDWRTEHRSRRRGEPCVPNKDNDDEERESSKLSQQVNGVICAASEQQANNRSSWWHNLEHLNDGPSQRHSSIDTASHQACLTSSWVIIAFHLVSQQNTKRFRTVEATAAGAVQKDRSPTYGLKVIEVKNSKHFHIHAGACTTTVIFKFARQRICTRPRNQRSSHNRF